MNLRWSAWSQVGMLGVMIVGAAGAQGATPADEGPARLELHRDFRVSPNSAEVKPVDVHTDLQVIEVDPRNAKDIDKTLRYLKEQLSTYSGKAVTQTVVVAPGQGRDEYFLEPETASKLGTQLGWSNSEIHVVESADAIPPQFRDAVAATKQLASGSVVYQGLLTSDRPLPNRPELPKSPAEWSFVFLRTALNGGVAAQTIMLIPGAHWDQAAVVGGFLGVMSGTLQAYQSYLLPVIERKGWIRPSEFKEAGVLELLGKDGVVAAGILASEEAMYVATHLQSSFDFKEVMTGALIDPFVEGTWYGAIARAERILSDRVKKGELKLSPEASRLVTRIADHPLAQAARPTVQRLVGGSLLEKAGPGIDQLALTEHAVALMSRFSSLAVSTATTALFSAHLNQLPGADLFLAGAGAAGGVALAHTYGINVMPTPTRLRQLGTAVKACFGRAVKGLFLRR